LVTKQKLNETLITLKAQFLANKISRDEIQEKNIIKKSKRKPGLSPPGSTCKICDIIMILG
jgi:hypothetical protein